MTSLPKINAANAAPQPAPFTIIPETTAHQIAVEDLHNLVFGPGRFARTAYRVRGRLGHERLLSFTALIGAQVSGSVWQTFVRIGGSAAIFLGPLAVHPDHAGRGCGQALLASALAAARLTSAEAVVLVGDAPYYRKAGFAPVGHQRIGWPGPVDPARVLAVELVAGAVQRLSGPIRAIRLPIGPEEL